MIAELERLMKEGTQGEWRVEEGYGDCGGRYRCIVSRDGNVTSENGAISEEDAALIVALHNAAPALVKVVKAGKKIEAEHERSKRMGDNLGVSPYRRCECEICVALREAT